MPDTHLEAVFNAADYRVQLGNRTLSLAIGTRCPVALADWLAQRGQRAGWFMTAYNPGARLEPLAQNRRRHAALARIADRHGFESLAARGVDPNGGWPDEPGLLLAGPSRVQASILAKRFGQAAILAIDSTRPTRLVWL